MVRISILRIGIKNNIYIFLILIISLFLYGCPYGIHTISWWSNTNTLTIYNDVNYDILTFYKNDNDTYSFYYTDSTKKYFGGYITLTEYDRFQIVYMKRYTFKIYIKNKEMSSFHTVKKDKIICYNFSHKEFEDMINSKNIIQVYHASEFINVAKPLISEAYETIVIRKPDGSLIATPADQLPYLPDGTLLDSNQHRQ